MPLIVAVGGVVLEDTVTDAVAVQLLVVLVTVTHVDTNHEMVRSASSNKGKYRFTATDAGPHRLCL